MTRDDTLLAEDDWRTRLMESLNTDEAFGHACEQADGSMTLVVGDERAWFKLYRGEIIDTESYVPAFGATFRLVGDRDAWQVLCRGETSLSEAIHTGRIRTGGNKLEANRLREALELLARQMQRLSEGGDE